MSKPWKNDGHQYFAAIAANLIMVDYGAIAGWSSPVLLSENTPLKDGPLTNEQVSWIGAGVTISAVVAPLVFEHITSIIGCKRAMCLITISSMLSWLLIYFGTTFYHIFLSRILIGVSGGGILITVVLYVAEISNDDIRGRLGSFLYLARNIGILMIFVMGAYIDYEYLPHLFFVIEIIFLVIIILLPNTPQFHMQRQNFEKAEKSLKYYKGVKCESVEESIAIKKEIIRLRTIAERNKSERKTNWKDLCERETVVGILIGLVLVFAAQFNGCFTFISYSTLIFEKTGSDIDPYFASIVAATLLLLGSICSAQLADILGRKFLLLISLIGSAAGLFALALYLFMKDIGYDLSIFSWLPLASLSFVIFISSAGIIPLASVCTVEHLPSKTRTAGVMITSMGLNGFASLSLKFFPILMETIDLYGCLLIYAISSLFKALFVLFVLNETKGKSLDAVKSVT